MFLDAEILGFTAASLTTASFLPQAILTLKTRDTESLSLGMYSLFTTGVLCWLIYGLWIMDRAIIFANAITFVLSAMILAFKLINTFKRLRKN
ncbi:MAG: SemiSWEET transporter [Methylococcales bacterium]|nr:SemiSWEET transporter [Methylococcales bacterium]